jgi:hypothetical protein
VIRETVRAAGVSCDYYLVNEKYNDFLEWLVEDATWAHRVFGFAVVPDGRGNFRFAAICGLNGDVHPFSIERALHGDFSEPRQPYDANKPFAGLTT